MRTITLVRHLRPVVGRPGDDERGLVDDAHPSTELVEAVRSAAHVVVSPLRRAQETASRAGVGDRGETRPELREAPLPPGRGGPTGRALWLLGRTGGVEPRHAVVDRLTDAADTLERLSHEGPVTVVAHGWANLELARILRRRGWRGRRLPRSGHGQVTVYAFKRALQEP